MQRVSWISRAVPWNCRSTIGPLADSCSLPASRVGGKGRRIAASTLAVAWAFMLSLLVGASYEMLGEWGRPPDENDWLSEGAFLAIVLTMTAIAASGLVSTLKTSQSS